MSDKSVTKFIYLFIYIYIYNIWYILSYSRYKKNDQQISGVQMSSEIKSYQ